MMAMTGNGNVGIGTTAPAARFDVAGHVNTSTQYQIGGAHALSAPGINNLFAGASAGNHNTGTDNTFIGNSAGVANSSGSFNTYVGVFAGAAGTSGDQNTAVGYNTSVGTSIDFDNTVVGYQAGNNGITDHNTIVGSQAGNTHMGSNNSHFGYHAGSSNYLGGLLSFDNSFFGAKSGISTTSGGFNSFFGTEAGDTNTTGSDNTLVGGKADVGSGDLNNATAIGHRAQVTQNNSLVLGSINGVNGAFNNTNVGIGTTAPAERLHVGTGNIYVGGAGQGVILKSPNGSVCRRLTIDNSGNLSVGNITCP